MKKNLRPFAWALIASFLLPLGIHAQEEGNTIVELYDRAIQAGENKEYDKAIGLCDQAISNYGSGALKRYGPVFGHFYYIKGIYLLRQKNYQAAIDPLKTCYEKWDNSSLTGLSEEEIARNKWLPNRYHIHALMQWGNALMALENFGDAAEKFEKTLAEDPRVEPLIDRINVAVNLARCYILSDQPDKGKDFILRAIDDQIVDRVGQQTLLMILAWDWSPDQPFEQVSKVFTPRSHLLSQDSLQNRYKRNPRLAALAAEALGQSDYIRALFWYSFLAPAQLVLQPELERKEVLKANIEKVKKSDRKDKERLIANGNDLIKDVDKTIKRVRGEWASMLLGTGAAHYQINSIAAARATYRILAENFPDHPERAQILHNLVVCDVNLEFWQEAYQYGTLFFAEFPDHPLKPNVTRVLVEVIFLQQEFQEAYEICHKILSDLPADSPVREIPQFVLGASAFHLEKVEEAERELESYIDTYPQGVRLEPVRFYLGSAKVNLLKWEEAGPLLEGFLKDYPQSGMRPSALYLSGLTQLVLEDFILALTRTESLLENFPEAPEIPASHNLHSDILTSLERSHDAVLSGHTRAREMVEKEGRGSNDVAAYALRQSITAAANVEEWELALEYYDQFRERYWESSYQIDATLAALDPMAQVGRTDEALGILVDFVNRVADAGDQRAELDQLFGSYLDFLDQHFSEEDKLIKLDAYPYTDLTNPPGALEAWIVMAKIEIIEGMDEPDLEARNVEFYKLLSLFDRNGKDLSSYTLVRLARWNWETNGREEQAREIYEFVLKDRNNAGTEAAGFALVDLAKLEGDSASPELQQQALDRFSRVLNEISNPGLRQEAVLGRARILTRQAAWDQAKAEWRTYLDDRSWTDARAEANYSYARSIDELGNPSQALKLYVSVYANFPGYLDWSTQAYLRAAQILREEGKGLDSLKVLQDMLKRMGHLEHSNIDKGKELFYAWRSELTQ